MSLSSWGRRRSSWRGASAREVDVTVGEEEAVESVREADLRRGREQEERGGSGGV
jgi:hypothetical protein